jgi:hypothetical protein
MNTENNTTGNSIALENDADHSKWSKNKNVSDSQFAPHSPLLPRSSWQSQRAFLSVLIRAKQALDMAEITAILWD